MIKNVVVAGCSFTDNEGNGWGDVINQYTKAEQFINLARSGAGNFYISNSLITTLSACNFDPSETLVLVMWSGVTRKDIVVGNDYWKLMINGNKTTGQPAATKNGIHYVMSGGIVGSWQDDSLTRPEHKWIIRPIFESLYRSASNQSMGHEVLTHMLTARSYLENYGYKYKFMSYLNYWQNTEGYFGHNLDFHIPYYCASDPLLSELGNNWIWVNKNKDSFFEFANNRNMLRDDEFHPTDEAHRLFANEVIIPQLKEFFV